MSAGSFYATRRALRATRSAMVNEPTYEDLVAGRDATQGPARPAARTPRAPTAAGDLQSIVSRPVHPGSSGVRQRDPALAIGERSDPRMSRDGSDIPIAHLGVTSQPPGAYPYNPNAPNLPRRLGDVARPFYQTPGHDPRDGRMMDGSTFEADGIAWQSIPPAVGGGAAAAPPGGPSLGSNYSSSIIDMFAAQSHQTRGEALPPPPPASSSQLLDAQGTWNGNAAKSSALGEEFVPAARPEDIRAPLMTLTNTSNEDSYIKVTVSSASREIRAAGTANAKSGIGFDLKQKDDTNDFSVQIDKGMFSRTDMELRSIQLADGHFVAAQRTIEPAWSRVYFDEGVCVTAQQRSLTLARSGTTGTAVQVALPLPYVPITSMESFLNDGSGTATYVRLRGPDMLALGSALLFDVYAARAGGAYPAVLDGIYASNLPLTLTSTNVAYIEPDGAIVMYIADFLTSLYPGLAAPGFTYTGSEEFPLAALIAPRPRSPADLAALFTAALRGGDLGSIAANAEVTYVASRDVFAVRVVRPVNATDPGSAGNGGQHILSDGIHTLSGSMRTMQLKSQLAQTTYYVGGDDLAQYMGVSGVRITIKAGNTAQQEWGGPRQHPAGSYLDIPTGDYATQTDLLTALDGAARRTIVENGPQPALLSEGLDCSGADSRPPAVAPVGGDIGFDIRRSADAATTTVTLTPGQYTLQTLVDAAQAQIDTALGAPGLIVLEIVQCPSGDACAGYGVQFTAPDDASLLLDFSTSHSGELFGYGADEVITSLGDTITPRCPVQHIPEDCEGLPMACPLRVAPRCEVEGAAAYVAQPPPRVSVAVGDVVADATVGQSMMNFYTISNLPVHLSYNYGTDVYLTRTTGTYTARLPDAVIRAVVMPSAAGDPAGSMRIMTAAAFDGTGGVTDVFVELRPPCALNIYNIPTAYTPCIAWYNRIGFSAMTLYHSDDGLVLSDAVLDVGSVPFVYLALFIDDIAAPIGRIYPTCPLPGGEDTRLLGYGGRDATARAALPRYEGALNAPQYFAVMLCKDCRYGLDFDRAFSYRFASEDSPGAMSRVRIALFNPNHTPYQTHGTPVQVSLRLSGYFTY